MHLTYYVWLNILDYVLKRDEIIENYSKFDVRILIKSTKTLFSLINEAYFGIVS